MTATAETIDAATRRPVRGLRAEVYRAVREPGGPHPDETLHHAGHVTIVGVDKSWTANTGACPEDLPIEFQSHEPTPNAPAVVLNIRDNGAVRWRSMIPLAPPADGRTPYMAGSALVHSMDPRFRKLTGETAVELHDYSCDWVVYDRNYG